MRAVLSRRSTTGAYDPAAAGLRPRGSEAPASEEPAVTVAVVHPVVDLAAADRMAVDLALVDLAAVGLAAVDLPACARRLVACVTSDGAAGRLARPRRAR